MTNLAVSAGADWQCSRCGSRWDSVRLATVAAYAVWVAAHTFTPFGVTFMHLRPLHDRLIVNAWLWNEDRPLPIGSLRRRQQQL